MLPYILKEDHKVEEATTSMFIIKINPSKVWDKALIEHEKTHVNQWWVGFLVGLLTSIVVYSTPHSNFAVVPLALGIAGFGLLYKLVPAFRYEMEVQAFAKQLILMGKGSFQTEAAAKAISLNYDLDITKEEALKKLKGKMK